MSNIVMLIKKVGGELEMRLESETPANEQESRRNGNNRNKKIKEKKKERQHHNENKGGHEHVSGIHQPIILVAGASDTVTFKADTGLTGPFVVDVEFDPNLVDEDHQEPTRTPFGWTTPQKSEKATSGPHSGFHIVEGTFADTGGSGDKPSDQMFYKATVWVDNLKLDPDFFCDR